LRGQLWRRTDDGTQGPDRKLLSTLTNKCKDR